ncbi:MAG: MGMT family protein [bacterium]|nr:MGMT family protein [bacterium]
MTFKEKICKIVSKIPRGQTMTYKEVAELANKPKAYRAVGSILNKNYNPAIPCHRVIRSDGKVGGYNRGVLKKKEILSKEGIVI